MKVCSFISPVLGLLNGAVKWHYLLKQLRFLRKYTLDTKTSMIGLKVSFLLRFYDHFLSCQIKKKKTHSFPFLMNLENYFSVFYHIVFYHLIWNHINQQSHYDYAESNICCLRIKHSDQKSIGGQDLSWTLVSYQGKKIINWLNDFKLVSFLKDHPQHRVCFIWWGCGSCSLLSELVLFGLTQFSPGLGLLLPHAGNV